MTHRTISRFEADRLRWLRVLLGTAPAEAQTVPLRTANTPQGFSPAAIALLADTLNKSVIRFLVRAGGWRVDRYLRSNLSVAGHPWRRSPTEECRLSFSGQWPAFLIAFHPQQELESAASTDTLTLADQVSFLIAAQHLIANPKLWKTLRRLPFFASNPLVWLANPMEMREASDIPSFTPLFTPPGPMILECLQPWLADRWCERDSSKQTLTNWQTMRTRGERENAILSRFLSAADAAGRRDLSRFILKAIARRASSDLSDWVGSLPEADALKLQDRVETRRSALSLIRQIEIFEKWNSEDRRVRYHDEGYAASQLAKQEYEAAGGERLAEKYRILLRQIDPLTSSA